MKNVGYTVSSCLGEIFKKKKKQGSNVLPRLRSRTGITKKKGLKWFSRQEIFLEGIWKSEVRTGGVALVSTVFLRMFMWGRYVSGGGGRAAQKVGGNYLH